VDQRYGKGTAERDAKDAPAFKYQAVIRDGVAVYKAACCLHYQCTEGNVPKRTLYKALELIVEVVADRVISHLPGYESAPWGD